MRWMGSLLFLGLLGCVSPRDERLDEYNADGVHLYSQGAYVEAQQSFEAALTLKPDDAALLYNLAQCCHRQGDYEEAERYYKQCLERAPNHVECRFALAQLLMQSGKQAEAKRTIQDWLAQNPERADAYALDAWYWHVTGDLPRAQARLHQALEREPHNQRALLELALLYEAMQRPGRAVVLYERVLADNPNHPEVEKRLQELLAKGAEKPRPDY